MILLTGSGTNLLTNNYQTCPTVSLFTSLQHLLLLPPHSPFMANTSPLTAYDILKTRHLRIIIVTSRKYIVMM